jgi:hypothetical protein
MFCSHLHGEKVPAGFCGWQLADAEASDTRRDYRGVTRTRCCLKSTSAHTGLAASPGCCFRGVYPTAAQNGFVGFVGFVGFIAGAAGDVPVDTDAADAADVTSSAAAGAGAPGMKERAVLRTSRLMSLKAFRCTATGLAGEIRARVRLKAQALREGGPGVLRPRPGGEMGDA